ncbi:MAG: TrmH family RNA methyltransferase [Acidobacteriota bacterium]|nr:TrmH family RNA methyltransferase [Acidobacteriota bacterium]
MTEFVQQRHKEPVKLAREREILVACEPMRSNVNLSSILRTVSCFAIPKVIASGQAKVIGKVARDGEHQVEVKIHRSLPPVLKKLKADGYRLVGLEQTNDSRCIFDYRFERRTCLVIGSERKGIDPENLALLDDVVEIPIWGLPYSLNVANATSMALYEYCRQFPEG